jgi:hypothetical protein
VLRIPRVPLAVVNVELKMAIYFRGKGPKLFEPNPDVVARVNGREMNNGFHGCAFGV